MTTDADSMWKSHKYQDRVPGWNRLSFAQRRKVKNWALNGLLVIAVLVVVFPIFWMFSTALRPRAEMTVQNPSLIPDTLTFTHYRAVLFDSQFPTYYANSLIISGGTVLVTVFASVLGGYGLSRIDIPQKRTFARGILVGYMFPSILLSIPMYIFWRELGIINTLLGAILATSAKTIPIGLWFMWKFFQTVPYSLEESAMVAGASRFRAFYEIALPRVRSGIVAVVILTFAISWDEYTIPKVLLPNQPKWPLTVAIDTLQKFDTFLWGEMMAVTTLALVPSFLILFFLQNHLLRGLRY